MGKKYTTEGWIKRAQEIHGDKYNYSKVNYINAKAKIIIICYKHGEFKQKPNAHLNGHGCSKCSGSYKYTTGEWIIKAQKIHGNKYDYSKVDYKNSNTKIIIICYEHGEFKQTPSMHISGQGCIKCAGLYKYKSDEWIKKAIEKHGNKYDYSKVDYQGNKIKVVIICPKHGEFKQRPNDHLSGHGCSKCAGFCNTKEWIEKVKKIHGNKYDYSKVSYINSGSKLLIICPEHGEFKQIANDHLQGNGCSKCSRNYNYDTVDWIDKAQEVHGMDKYDYIFVDYINSRTNVIIFCSEHGKFEQNPHMHLQGQGCPKCQMCPKCGLWRTRGVLCEYCKPKNKNKQYIKTKEYNVVNYLKEQLPDEEFIHNKSVGKECTNGHLFPDIRFNCYFYQLIIEVDEHKHRGANYECDEKRMYDIIAKCGQPCIFIRYNPDSKESNQEILLEYIKKYLNIDIEEDDIPWDEFGFKVEYLFY